MPPLLGVIAGAVGVAAGAWILFKPEPIARVMRGLARDTAGDTFARTFYETWYFRIAGLAWIAIAGYILVVGGILPLIDPEFPLLGK